MTPETLYLLLRCLQVNVTMEQVRTSTLPERNIVWQWASARFLEQNHDFDL